MGAPLDRSRENRRLHAVRPDDDVLYERIWRSCLSNHNHTKTRSGWSKRDLTRVHQEILLLDAETVLAPNGWMRLNKIDDAVTAR